MVYDFNGDQIVGDLYFSKAINEINCMMVDLISLLEKETIARELNKYKVSADQTLSGEEIAPVQMKMSASSGDTFAARQSALGKFDEQKAKLILESEDICKEYEKWCELDFNKIFSKGKSERTGNDQTIVDYYTSLSEQGFTHSQIKKYILESFYNISDNPEDIKKLLKLRLNYNKKMISLYQKMIKLNYDVLNLSKMEAEYIADSGNIEEIRKFILDNKDKFIKRNGTFYDLRELGGGVAFLKDGCTKDRLKDFITFEHFISFLMRYDVTVLTHGGFNAKRFLSFIRDKKYREECGFFFKFWVKFLKLRSLIAAKMQPDPQLVKEVEEMTKDMDLKSELGVNDPLTGPIGSRAKWICQPIRTEKKGPFRSVVKLLEQCIKEARDNKSKYNMIRNSSNHVHIMVMCCNPGGISLPKSITGQKDVHIHYGKTSVMAENTEYTDIDRAINDGEKILQEFCNQVGIDYNDDEYLNECYNNITDEDIDVMVEGVVSKAWDIVKAAAKKVWAAIVAAFKWLWEFFKKIWNAIKSLFVKNKDSEVKNVSYIQLEGAKVNKKDSMTFGKVQQEILNSCNTISSKIKQLESTQTSIMKRIDQELNKK